MFACITKWISSAISGAWSRLSVDESDIIIGSINTTQALWDRKNTYLDFPDYKFQAALQCLCFKSLQNLKTMRKLWSSFWSRIYSRNEILADREDNKEGIETTWRWQLNHRPSFHFYRRQKSVLWSPRFGEFLSGLLFIPPNDLEERQFPCLPSGY